MTLLEDAIGALMRARDSSRIDAGASDSDVVERVDVAKDGAVLIECRDLPSRWYRYSKGALTRIEPCSDHDVPLADGARGMPLLAYRPGRRVVFYEPSTGRVWKGVRRGRGASFLRKQITGAEAASKAGFSVAHVEGTLPDLEAVVLRWLPGSRITVAKHGDSFFRLGALLRAFQEVPRDEHAGFHGCGEELAVLDAWSRRLGTLEVSIPANWSRVVRRIDEVGRLLADGPRVLVHRDLHDGQVLVNGDRIGLLDFDLCTTGDAALDAGNFSAHLTLRSLQSGGRGDEPAVLDATEAFLDGLDRSGEPGFWGRFRFYQATAFLRLALVYSLRPRWVSHTDALAGFAETCVSEVAV